MFKVRTETGRFVSCNRRRALLGLLLGRAGGLAGRQG